jgi:hypothetical protein
MFSRRERQKSMMYILPGISLIKLPPISILFFFASEKRKGEKGREGKVLIDKTTNSDEVADSSNE